MHKAKCPKCDKITAEEKDRMKELDNLDSLPKEFYKDYLDAQGLWEWLKEGNVWTLGKYQNCK